VRERWTQEKRPPGIKYRVSVVIRKTVRAVKTGCRTLINKGEKAELGKARILRVGEEVGQLIPFEPEKGVERAIPFTHITNDVGRTCPTRRSTRIIWGSKKTGLNKTQGGSQKKTSGEWNKNWAKHLTLKMVTHAIRSILHVNQQPYSTALPPAGRIKGQGTARRAFRA